MSKKPKPFHNPFGALKLPAKAAPVPAAKPAPAPAPRHDAGLSDDELWSLATDGADALTDRAGRVRPDPRPIAQAQQPIDAELAAYDELRALVDGALPFELAQAGEPLQGAAQGLDARVVKKLKRGEFGVEGRLDLHGLSQAEARAALERFVVSARREGRRCVLVVHGRGLHSPDQVAVLKEAVRRALGSDKLGREVLAFAQARPQDGGAGAVYVLLKRA